MAKIESKEVTVNAPIQEVYDYLLNINNLQHLMPEDKVEKWESTEDSCSFQIKGLAKIGMRKESSQEPEKIHLVSEGKNPFEFTLDIMFTAADQQTKSKMIFDADVNPFMKMMIDKPLTNFFNMLAEKLVEVKS